MAPASASALSFCVRCPGDNASASSICLAAALMSRPSTCLTVRTVIAGPSASGRKKNTSDSIWRVRVRPFMSRCTWS